MPVLFWCWPTYNSWTNSGNEMIKDCFLLI